MSWQARELRYLVGMCACDDIVKHAYAHADVKLLLPVMLCHLYVATLVLLGAGVYHVSPYWTQTSVSCYYGSCSRALKWRLCGNYRPTNLLVAPHILNITAMSINMVPNRSLDNV